MKKLLLGALLLLSMTTIAQVNTKDLIGYWTPDQESTQLFFWKDVTGKLQVQEISGTSGEPLDNITFRVDKNSVYLKTIFTPNSWVTENVFTFVDKNTLKCVITGENLEGETIITYKKIK